LTSAAGPEAAFEAAGFVLAGGQSSRMGTDKALLELNGEPLIVCALQTLRRAGLTTAIAGASSELSAYGQVIEDAGQGPLSGICAALASTDARLVVFTSVDMPLLPAALIGYLLEHARQTGAGITLISVNGFVQTFPVVIHRSLLPALADELKNGKGTCLSAFRVAAGYGSRPFRILPLENLVQAGQLEDPYGLPPAFWFLNINTPDDFDRARSLLRQAGHPIA